MTTAEKKPALKGNGWIGVTLHLEMHKAWVDRGPPLSATPWKGSFNDMLLSLSRPPIPMSLIQKLLQSSQPNTVNYYNPQAFNNNLVLWYSDLNFCPSVLK